MTYNKEYCGCVTRGGIIVIFCESHRKLYWGSKQRIKSK